MDTVSTDELLTTTRAVRRRLDLERPVDGGLITECLRIAVQAPSGSNRQLWRWIVVTDPALRRGVAEIYRGACEEPFRRALDAATSEGERRAYAGALYLSEVLERVPVHIIPCHQGRVDGGSNARAAGFYGSIFPAVWNLQLALHSRGLGSTLTTIHLRREAEMAALLGVPADVSQVALLPVAHTTGEGFRPAERRPVEELTHVNGWQHPDPSGT